MNQSFYQPVIELGDQSRGTFIARTYSHLFGAIMAFTLIEVVLFKTGIAEIMARAMLGVSWLLVLGGFMVVSWLASRVAHQATSLPAQYAALGGFVVAEAIVFVPLLYMANQFAPGRHCLCSGNHLHRLYRAFVHRFPHP